TTVKGMGLLVLSSWAVATSRTAPTVVVRTWFAPGKLSPKSTKTYAVGTTRSSRISRRGRNPVRLALRSLFFERLGNQEFRRMAHLRSTRVDYDSRRYLWIARGPGFYTAKIGFLNVFGQGRARSRLRCETQLTLAGGLR